MEGDGPPGGERCFRALARNDECLSAKMETVEAA